jgi:hypothetical protein
MMFRPLQYSLHIGALFTEATTISPCWASRLRSTITN